MQIEALTLVALSMYSALIASVVLLLSFLNGIKNPDKEKVGVYECGFDPFHSPGKPFSIRFFLVAILFLIFDLELSYLFPWAATTNLVSLKGQMIVAIFILVLSLGLIYE